MEGEMRQVRLGGIDTDEERGPKVRHTGEGEVFDAEVLVGQGRN